MSESSRVCVAFIWHMHQPVYEDPGHAAYVMPWTRLHGAKDYFDLVALTESFDGMRCTVNVVPSLVEQILGYTRGTHTDRYLELSRTPAATLGAADRRFVLDNFFSLNHTHMLGRHARYRELRDAYHGVEVTDAAAVPAADLQDLLTLFNLAWIDPVFLARPELQRLVERGRDYTLADTLAVLDAQLEILGGILPLYRRLADQGLIELTTTPYYHPILPLLLDGNSAREALPGATLPGSPPVYPDDFDAQVELALQSHIEHFGRPARGLWPAEGAVSDATARRLVRHGVEWIATDEEVLARSLAPAPRSPLRPYRLEDGGRHLDVVFRHQRLSDLIGFTYMHWDADAAAEHFVAELLDGAAAAPAGAAAPPLVAVILDGENCWEHYVDDGAPFLRSLYGRLCDTPAIEPTTVSAYLDRHPSRERLDRLFAGSWIHHSFSIWIGHPEDNAAWDLLADAQRALAASTVDAATRARARRHLLIAEGSDWFWWFGDEHWSHQAMAFDALFRGHLQQVYRLIGAPVPSGLLHPIKDRFSARPPQTTVPVRFIAPYLDGRVTHYYEWQLAGRVDARPGAAHAGGRWLRSIHYGFDRERLYVRADGDAPFHRWDDLDRYAVWIDVAGRRVIAPLAPASGERLAPRLELLGEGSGAGDAPPADPEALVAVLDVLELQVRFAALGVAPGTELTLSVSLAGDARPLQTVPTDRPLVFTAPDAHFEATMWSAS